MISDKPHDTNIMHQSTSQPALDKASATSSQSPAIECKKCQRCQGNLPKEFYGLRKEMKDGRYSYCKACVAEARRKRWEEKHGRVRHTDKDYGPIRDITRHNPLMLQALIANPNIHIYGYDPITLKTYKVYWGLNKTIQMPSLAMFDMNATLYREWISSGDSKFTDHLVEYLKTHNIRLELSEADIVISQRVVYYLNV